MKNNIRRYGSMAHACLPVYLFAFLLLLASCGANEEDDLFPESAAQRINHSVAEWKDILTSSDNGWVMEYLPGDGSYGGYVYTVKFTDVDAIMASADITFSNSSTGESLPPGTEEASKYSVKAEQGVILSFDTYNTFFHYFSRPISSSYPDGYGGDYEFIFNKLSDNKDTIYFTGKKHGNEMVMFKLKEITAHAYTQQVVKMRDALTSLNFTNIKVGGKAYSISAGRTLEITDTTEADSSVTAPIFFTTTGCHTYKPISFNGTNFQDLQLDYSKAAFVSPDNLVELAIPSVKDQIEKPKGYGKNLIYYLGSVYGWIFDKTQMDDESKAMYEYLQDIPRALYDTSPFEGVFLGPPLWSRDYANGAKQVLGFQYESILGEIPFTFGVNYNFNPDDNSISISLDGYERCIDQYDDFVDRDVRPLVNRIVNNSPYKVTLNDGIRKTEMRLESINNPSVYFGLKFSQGFSTGF